MVEREKTNMEVKKNNRNRIFRYLCSQRDTVSNPDIAYALKMSLPTVTQNTKEFIKRGLVLETGELQSTGGRRAKALAVAVNCQLAVGLDITKNHIGLALANVVGDCLRYERIYLPYEASDAYHDRVNEELESFLRRCQAEQEGLARDRILGIGISFPGIVNLEREEITYSHVLGLQSIPFQKVSRYFDFPCYFLNDANAGAYAEGLHTMVPERFFYLSLSNTVGGAVFEHGVLVQGTNYRCGEAGHMTIVPGGRKCYCGKDGCLDAYCSAKLLSDSAGGSLELFFKRLSEKEEKTAALWDEYTTYLATAINNIHMVLDCDIILGGYVGSYTERHMEEIREKASGRNTFSENGNYIKACTYKAGTAAMGAALNVIERFIEQV